jgi:hypothetical protein
VGRTLDDCRNGSAFLDEITSASPRASTMLRRIVSSFAIILIEKIDRRIPGSGRPFPRWPA